MTPLKVALVSFDFGEYCVRLASGLAQDPETDVHLFLPDYEAEPHLGTLSKSVKLQVFKKPRLRQPFSQFRMVTNLVRKIRKINPDLIHLQSGHLWFNWALPFLGDRPLVLTIHDPSIHVGDADSGKTPQWVLDRACYRARQRIVHAPQVKESLLQRLPIPSSSVHVIPHIRIGGDEVPEQVCADENLILFFGRIWEYKGLEYLIRAEPTVTSKVPQAKIVIAGRGEDFDRYRRLMVHPENFIVYNEYVSDEKRADLFRRASVVVLPYTEASQSGVIPIAYHFGKPVVATDVGGLPDMVEHGRTGLLVPPRDANALAEALILLLQNKELRRQYAENGRRKMSTECAPEIVARKTRNVYLQALSVAQQPIKDMRQGLTDFL